MYESIVFQKWKWSESGSVVSDSLDCIALGILQAWILEWVAFPISRGSSQPRDWTHISHIAGRFFTSWAKVQVKIGLRGFPVSPVTQNWCFHWPDQVRSPVRELRSQGAWQKKKKTTGLKSLYIEFSLSYYEYKYYKRKRELYRSSVRILGWSFLI